MPYFIHTGKEYKEVIPGMDLFFKIGPKRDLKFPENKAVVHQCVEPNEDFPFGEIRCNMDTTFGIPKYEAYVPEVFSAIWVPKDDTEVDLP